jgi:hypothetical protein
MCGAIHSCVDQAHFDRSLFELQLFAACHAHQGLAAGTPPPRRQTPDHNRTTMLDLERLLSLKQQRLLNPVIQGYSANVLF